MDDTSYSTGGFKDRGLEAALDAIAEAGFPQAELQAIKEHAPAPFTGRELAGFRARLDGSGVRTRTMHAPSGRSVLGAPDERWRKESVEVLKRYLAFGGELGITDMVVHPLPSPDSVPNADRPEVPGLIADAAKRSLDELVPAATQAGIRFNLENLPFDCSFPYLTMKELRPLVDPYPEDAVGLIIDTGHVGVLGNDPVEEISVAGHRLRGTHLHDVVRHASGGDHHTPAQGLLDWNAMLGAFEAIGYPGPWTYEVARSANDESPEDLARTTAEFAAGWRR